MEGMRDRFVGVTTSLLDERNDVAVVLAAISAALFRESGARSRHPNRVIDVGIREQLLIGVAAGMALEGYRPFVHTYAPFLVERAYEQVKLDFGHQGSGAVLVSVGASYDAAAAGRTHQAPEDVALILTLPGWRAYAPGHPDEVETILRTEASGRGCAYVRLSEERNTASVDLPTRGIATIRRAGEASIVSSIASATRSGIVGDSKKF